MDNPTPNATMPYYAPNGYHPPPPGTRSRGSSAASRYVPDGYPMPPPASKTASNDYLAPPQQEQQNSQPAPDHSSHAFAPVRPEQYRPPQDTRGIPPAQLRPYHPDAPIPRHDGYVARRSLDARSIDARRPGSIDSRRSGSHRSHHSSRSHRSSHDGHRDARRRDYERAREDDYLRDRERDRHHHKRRHSSYDDRRLDRRDTPRGYGSSLFAFFDSIKKSIKG